MNKAITDGLQLMPPPFTEGLNVWSSGDGTPGSATYDGAGNAALVPADQDFGGCLEMVKTSGTQKLRYKGQTPILPGCYLRVTARVKAMSGALPSVRIAGWAGAPNNSHVGGLDETGPSTTLTSYGEVVEITAIIGSGNRSGVDMVWGTEPAYGHIGLDLTGSNGGVVRVDDLVIEDITQVFLREMMDWVDVRDYGAKGNGVANDAAAFNAADAAADGRWVLVPEGTYRLASSVSMDSRVRFEGTITQPDEEWLILKRNFDYNSYLDAFGEEMTAFRKAWQALLNTSQHESLDLCGRRIELNEPLDMQALVPNKTTYEVRRVIRNGQFVCSAGSGWDTYSFTTSASYSSNSKTLTNVNNVSSVRIGSLVEGAGVGREVYVLGKNVGAKQLTLSQPLWGAASNQNYTFKRFKYIMDFSGFDKVSKLTFTDVEFQCAGQGSGILLAPEGETVHLRDCFFTRVNDRAISSHGRGCQDLQIDRCHFTSDEQSTPNPARKSLAFNVNANDSKIRNNRFQRFRHTAIINGNGHIIMGNHLFQGDGVERGPRLSGITLTYPNAHCFLSGNYIDNCSIEMANEQDGAPEFSSEFTFGGVTMTGNIFTCSSAATSFHFILIKPYGPGHFLQGLNVNGNTFKAINGAIERVEGVDTTHADLDFGLVRNVIFEGNTYNGVSQQTQNPVTLEFNQASEASTWSLNVGDYLPFEGNARTVSSVVMRSDIKNGSNQNLYVMPTVVINAGSGNDLVQLKWPQACRGRVFVTARVDRPT